MPMSFGGHVASSSACATRPKEQEIGSADYAVPTQHSSPIGHSVMATAEHREPCDSRGSCTVLGAPGGETPPGDSTFTSKTLSPLSNQGGHSHARTRREVPETALSICSNFGTVELELLDQLIGTSLQ